MYGRLAGERRMIFLICLAGMFVCCVLLYITPYLYLVKLGYAVERLAAERRGLWQAQQTLRLEAASLRSFERVEAWCREEGKMRYPERQQLIYVVLE